MRLLLHPLRGQSSSVRPCCAPVLPLRPSFSLPRTNPLLSARREVESSRRQGHRQWKWQWKWEWQWQRQKQRQGGQRQSRWQWGGSQQYARPAPLLAAANGAALGTAAFVELSGEENTIPSQTGEKRMLQASRAEIAKKLDDNDRGVSRLYHNIILYLDLYLWEPLCTGFRFLHLAVIFVPVLVAVPIIWVGKRHKHRDNERMGALWWYNFLVKAMEWAGPAFIKVSTSWIEYMSSLQSQMLSTYHAAGSVGRLSV